MSNYDRGRKQCLAGWAMSRLPASEGVGIFATTAFGTTGNATITAAGSVAATGIGLWSNANGGTAIATSTGVVNVGGGAGNLTLFVPSEPVAVAVLPIFFKAAGIPWALRRNPSTTSATASLIAVGAGGASVGSVNAPDIGLAATAGTLPAQVVFVKECHRCR